MGIPSPRVFRFLLFFPVFLVPCPRDLPAGHPHIIDPAQLNLETEDISLTLADTIVIVLYDYDREVLQMSIGRRILECDFVAAGPRDKCCIFSIERKK